MDAKQEGFDKSDWIGQGKLWASAPPMVRKAVNEAFSMPQHMEDLLHLPIAQMLEFGLPLQNTSPSAPLPAQYFSSTPPDITGEALRLRVQRLPIPDTKTVHKLLATSRQSWSDGTQSIIYSHLGGDVNHFPLELWSISSGTRGVPSAIVSSRSIKTESRQEEADSESDLESDLDVNAELYVEPVVLGRVAQNSFLRPLKDPKNKVFSLAPSPSPVPQVFSSQGAVTRHLNTWS
ncbi:hypothetical protein DFH08DRAFT_819925 [Mycena albidolilacea]|uniref:Uncharacterized protein n=1 Tax=Mycena albidolilacea TaxID=1033008 RepID=A0AAD6ZDR2_9AGAR|nr:hypothetical protein DFH08DRAFT_819925 [Mycena albidolilacea]